MGVVRRLKLDRFSQTETREFLAQVLGGPVDASGAAVMHAQAEGVPFIVEEMAFAYREGGMIQEIDGVWTPGRERRAAGALRGEDADLAARRRSSRTTRRRSWPSRRSWAGGSA